MKKSDNNTVQSYIKALKEKGANVKDIQMKLGSVDKFISWAYNHSYIENGLYKQLNDEFANYE